MQGIHLPYTCFPPLAYSRIQPGRAHLRPHTFIAPQLSNILYSFTPL